MSLLANQNFINQVAKEMGVPNLDQDTATVLQTLVQLETRRLLHQASKFAHSDIRDQVSLDDLNNALIELHHSDIFLVEQEEDFVRDGSSYIRRDPVYRSAQNFIEEQLKLLPVNAFSTPKFRGRWIYLQGRIPHINENTSLKCKSDIIAIREKELGSKKKKFNIIQDQPMSMLISHQQDYFKTVTGLLEEGDDAIGKIGRIDYTGNLNNLFPLFLKFFMGSQMTDIKMTFFLQILENLYIEKSAEHHLHQILPLLWAYQGYLCLKTGFRIGFYFKKFQTKYPSLMDQWFDLREIWCKNSIEARIKVYCSIIKKIAIELMSGLTFLIEEEILIALEEDINEGVHEAVMCKSVMREFGSHIECLRMRNSAFWLPATEIQGCSYMMMTL